MSALEDLPSFPSPGAPFAPRKEVDDPDRELEEDEDDDDLITTAADVVRKVTIPGSNHEIVVIGTSAVSETAGETVVRVMRELKPDAVMLEVDPFRVNSELGSVWTPKGSMKLQYSESLRYSKDCDKVEAEPAPVAADTLQEQAYRHAFGKPLLEQLAVFQTRWQVGYAHVDDLKYNQGMRTATTEAGRQRIPVFLGDRYSTITRARAVEELGNDAILRRMLLAACGIEVPIDYAPSWEAYGKLLAAAKGKDWEGAAKLLTELALEAKSTPAAKKMQAECPRLQELDDERHRIGIKAIAEGKIERSEVIAFKALCKKRVDVAAHLPTDSVDGTLATKALGAETDILLSYNAWALCEMLKRSPQKFALPEEKASLESNKGKGDDCEDDEDDQEDNAGKEDDGEHGGHDASEDSERDKRGSRLVVIVGPGRVEGVASRLASFNDRTMTYKNDVAPVVGYPESNFLDAGTLVGSGVPTYLYHRRLTRLKRTGKIRTFLVWTASVIAWKVFDTAVLLPATLKRGKAQADDIYNDTQQLRFRAYTALKG